MFLQRYIHEELLAAGKFVSPVLKWLEKRSPPWANLAGATYIIIDEAHRLNENSLLPKIMRLFNTNYRLFITGTPL